METARTLNRLRVKMNLLDSPAAGTSGFDTRPRYFEPVLSWNDRLLSRAFSEIRLGPGLKLHLYSLTPQTTLTVAFEVGHSPLEFTFYESGRLEYTIIDRNRQTISSCSRPGLSTLSYVPSARGTMAFRPEAPIKALSIRADPRFVSHHLGPLSPDLPQAFRQVLCNSNSSSKNFYSEAPMTPAMEIAVQQILNCPCQDAMKPVYLAGKALELIALRVSQLIRTPDRPKIQEQDLAPIRQCRELLLRNIQAPPSLRDLAKAVGLPHTKLNREFRKRYGTTVFAYLRQQRLNQGLALLQAGTMNVTQIAYETGFSSPSHFSRAFFQRYGLQPSSLLKSTES